MKAHYMSIFLILSLVGADSVSEEQNRRILHQPLFPATSSPPPPESELPPPPATPDSLNPDQPFFHELPNGPTGPTTDQGPQTRPSPAGGSSAANSVAAQQSKPIKKLAIAITSTILTLGILTALAFYLYKRRKNHNNESQKLFGGSHRNNEESNLPPSNFLYIGTVEPSARTLVNENEGENDSPYGKLNWGKRSERYRPSPELQPMPPLPKPPPPPGINSPPPMSSSDDESSETNFYTPQGSLKSNESFGSRNGYLNNVISQVNNTRPDNGSVPRSKTTSRKSHLTASSMDTKPVIIPSIKQSFIPTRPKFSAPPPPPDMARLQLISSDDPNICKIPITPPPPPPPPPPHSLPSKSSKVGAVEAHTSLSISKQIKSDSPKGTPKIEKGSPVKNGVTSSLEKADLEETDGSKPKLKPLHWDKVRTNADQATVWDQIKSSSFQLNEDAMETLFGCNSVNSVPKEATRTRSLPSLEQENRVLDPKKSQNIAILLRALNVTTEEVTEALFDGNPEGLGPELLETLVKMAPTKEEEIKLKDYDGEISKLGSAERFLKAILDVPFAFKRVEAMLYKANFNTEVKYLRNSFQALEEASEELKNSRLFLKLLEAVLRTGNRMNDGTNRGDAKAFKLDTLLKLVDIKGTDGKTTLLHFVVQEIIRSEGTGSNPENESVPNTNFKFKEEEFKKQGLRVVSGLSKELCNVMKAAGMDSDVLSSYVTKLEMGLEKLRLVGKQTTQDKFFVSMKEFLKEAIEEISKVKAEEKKALSHVKEATQYFHGDAAKEEAHPFRIFMIVRDFLSVLDNVCKDVGRMQDRTTVGAGRSFRMPATVSLPVLNRFNVRHDTSSDGDSV